MKISDLIKQFESKEKTACSGAKATGFNRALFIAGKPVGNSNPQEFHAKLFCKDQIRYCVLPTASDAHKLKYEYLDWDILNEFPTDEELALFLNQKKDV